VTTLRAKARSFSGSVRLKAPSEPFDKHCADLVTRQGQMAPRTHMPPIAQVFGHVLAADAGLACVTWIHSYHRTSSFSVSRARAAIERLQTLAKVLT
jgi:hypothetical protein